jgi:hypothetical protein
MSAAAALAPHLPALEPTPFQGRLLITPEIYDLVLGGGRGGGKSYGLGLLVIRHAEMYGQDARILFVRKTHSGCEDFIALTRQLFGMLYGTKARFNANEGLWKLPNGATLEINQYADTSDFSKYQGRSFTFIMVDEAGQYSDPSLIDLLRSCLRGPKHVALRFALAANPGGPGHAWLSKRHMFKAPAWKPYTEESTGRAFINAPSVFIDNPCIDQDEYRKQLDAATSTDPELGRAWKFGDWSVARGAFFSAVLDQSRVMIEPWDPKSLARKPPPEDPNNQGAWLRRMIEIQNGGPAPSWDLFLAHDFGVSAPSVTYVVAESPGTEGPDGRYYPKDSILLLDEFASNEPGSLDKGMQYTVPILAECVKELAKRWDMRPQGVADDSIFSRTGSSAGTIADEFARQGVFFRRARKGERIPGWQVMRRLLQDAGSADRPGLFVSRLCSYWWDTVPALPRDPRRTDDVDSRANDHAADACRYALNRTPGPTTSTVYGILGSY